METLFTQAFGLSSPWRVVSVDFQPAEGRISLQIDNPAKRLDCPVCGAAEQPIHDRPGLGPSGQGQIPNLAQKFTPGHLEEGGKLDHPAAGPDALAAALRIKDSSCLAASAAALLASG